MNIYSRIRAEQFAEKQLEQIKQIAEGGPEVALAYFQSQDRPQVTPRHCEMLFRQCVDLLDRHPEPWWVERGQFFRVYLDWTGPGVEAVR